MKSIVEKIHEGLYAIAIWDDTWKSFNNCYLICVEDEKILIDTGKAIQSQELAMALDNIGIEKEDITTIVLTHGHWDHVGGIGIFPNAEKFIHSRDYQLLRSEELKDVMQLNSDTGTIKGLKYKWVGHHTPGSIVLYSSYHKALFAGDLHSFFGEETEGQIVGEWKEIRDKSINFVKELVHTENAYSEHKLDEYFQGLRFISSLDVDYLCTGHGMVLKDNIGEFIMDLLSNDVESNDKS